ncbi:hypothetical protein PHLCEN_2v3577 [Hermanssonia centrifuga]|uniref:Uncharacterized protein n=1 Tax=Hermanssonia centrifuga TaxID=98765 RepID=A0A2R6QEP4_9APHY|nr:hypothetical protein PHLCEN_2v3577 [Hermanssonia centrifuga]
MLNLRKVGEPENEHYDDAGSRSLGVGFRLPSFASIAGNMGEDLDHGPEEEVFDVVEDNVCIVQAEAAAIPVAVVEYRASQDNTASENCEI